jgi:hypothetical protein
MRLDYLTTLSVNFSPKCYWTPCGVSTCDFVPTTTCFVPIWNTLCSVDVISLAAISLATNFQMVLRNVKWPEFPDVAFIAS